MKNDYIEEKVIGVINDLKDYATQLRDIRPETLTMVCNAWFEKLESIKYNFQGDTKIVFIGEFSSGKSTFANALLGENILPTAKSPCTSVITEVELVSDGQGHRGKIFYIDQKSSDDMPSFDDLCSTGSSGAPRSPGKFPPPKCMFRLVIHTNAEKSKGFFLSAIGMPARSTNGIMGLSQGRINAASKRS